MPNAKKKDPAYLSPDVEIIIRAGQSELSAIAFYSRGDGTWDVLVGVSHPSYRTNIATVLRWGAGVVEEAAFAITGLPSTEPSGEGEEPFDGLPF